MHYKLRILFSLVFLVALPSVSFAGQVYFLLKGENDKIVQFEVTDQVIEKVGTSRYQAVLPGMDGKPHDVRGPLIRDLLKAAGLSGERAFAVALDKYEVDIPMSDFETYDVIAAIEVDGKAISVRNKGPAWIVYPTVDHPELGENPVYETRSIWQLKEIVIK